MGITSASDIEKNKTRWRQYKSGYAWFTDNTLRIKLNKYQYFGNSVDNNTFYDYGAFAVDVKYELIGVAETKVNALANGAVKQNADDIGLIEAAIADMDASYADTNEGVLTSITQVNGKITAATQRKVKMADMSDTDVFVFYYGITTELI